MSIRVDPRFCHLTGEADARQSAVRHGDVTQATHIARYYLPAWVAHVKQEPTDLDIFDVVQTAPGTIYKALPTSKPPTPDTYISNSILNVMDSHIANSKGIFNLLMLIGAFTFKVAMPKHGGGTGLSISPRVTLNENYLAIAERAVTDAKVGVVSASNQDYFDQWSQHSTKQHAEKEVLRVKKKRKAEVSKKNEIEKAKKKKAKETKVKRKRAADTQSEK